MIVDFNDIIFDDTKSGCKIPKECYLSEGKYQIIDQGQNEIAGYTNNDEGIYTDVPAIIFGDHTRIIKYVDKPFFLGADGVKVLKAKDKNTNYKYLFYALSNVKIPDTGYNRHFKWIKESEVCYPDYEQQKEIVNVLDKLTDLIDKRKKQLEKLDELVKARFVEMFGDPVENEKEWESVPLVTLTSKIGSGATPRGGRESYCAEGISLIRSMNVHNGLFEYKDLAHISDEQAKQLDNVTIQKQDVLLNITGASVARCCIVPDDMLPARVNQHVCIIRCKSAISPVFLNHLFINDSYQRFLLNTAGGGATREAITKQQIENFRIITPPIESQKVFADFVAKNDKLKSEAQKGLEKLELLKNALMQKYFG